MPSQIGFDDTEYELLREFDKIYLNMPKKKKDRIIVTVDELHKKIESSFDCKKCGNCCRRGKDILIDGRDINKLAKELKVTKDEFIEKYVKVDNGRSFLIVNGECGFLNEDNTCSVHDSKPNFCRKYPFLTPFTAYLFFFVDNNMDVKRLPVKFPLPCDALKNLIE